METAERVAGAQASWSDEQIIERVLGGEIELYELLVRRYNQRLYRTARAILRDDTEAEDVMQEAYVRAFQNLPKFEGRSSFSTWLTRIAVHEALGRRKANGKFESSEEASLEELGLSMANSPEQETAHRETRELLEAAILTLPQDYRSVLILRDVEEMTTAETAEALALSEDAVKVRLHRARAKLRRELYARAGASSAQAFQFHAVRCDRVAAAVLARIRQL